MWVFGMCDTSVTPALGYMELVPRRNAATLLPIIAANVLLERPSIRMSGAPKTGLQISLGLQAMAWSITLSILSIP